MSRQRRRSILTAALAAVVVCGLALGATPGGAQARAHGASGGTIVIDYLNDFSSLDTGKCYDTQCYPFMRAMYDRLIDYDTAHAPGTALVPDAATAMPTISNGGLTYTFKLRNDVHFWNGRLATSADWVYSFERIVNPATQSGAASFWLNIVGAKAYATGKAAHVSGIQALGPFGLRITLISPDASFLNVLAMPFGSVVDRNQIATYGKSYSQLHPMGTGPYMFQEHTLGQRLILVRNPHYFKPGVGHADRIQADLGVTSETAFLRIQKGQADLDGDEPSIPGAEFLSVLQDPIWSKQLTRQVQVGTWYISMNVQVKPFDNLLVRRAVNMAINKPLLVRLVNGRATVTNTFLPPTMPGHGDFNLYPYDPVKARQLMAQAGSPTASAPRSSPTTCRTTRAFPRPSSPCWRPSASRPSSRRSPAPHGRPWWEPSARWRSRGRNTTWTSRTRTISSSPASVAPRPCPVPSTSRGTVTPRSMRSRSGSSA